MSSSAGSSTRDAIRAHSAATERKLGRSPAGPPWSYVLSGARCDSRALRLRNPGELGAGHVRPALTALLARAAVGALRARFQIRLSGEIPPSGCVLVSHHDSYWDGVMAAALDPRVFPVVSRGWRSIPGLGRFLNAYGVLWTGAETIEHATAAVGRGEICWLAPRAFDRGGGPTPAHLGAALICTGADVPLVPLVFAGLSAATRGRPPRSVAHVDIGVPFWPQGGESAAEFSSRAEAALPGAGY